MSNELKPCPNPECCGEGLFYCGGNQDFYIPCTTCGMRGPVKQTPDEALEAWNSIPRREDAAELVEALETCMGCLSPFQSKKDSAALEKAKSALANWRK